MVAMLKRTKPLCGLWLTAVDKSRMALAKSPMYWEENANDANASKQCRDEGINEGNTKNRPRKEW